MLHFADNENAKPPAKPSDPASTDEVYRPRSGQARTPREARRFRNLSSPNFNDFRSASVVTPNSESAKQTDDFLSKRKSLLNTSYSSEEILFQAASSLQGLEGESFQWTSVFPFFEALDTWEDSSSELTAPSFHPWVNRQHL